MGKGNNSSNKNILKIGSLLFCPGTRTNQMKMKEMKVCVVYKIGNI